MEVEVLVPHSRKEPLDAVLLRLSESPLRLTPFASETIDFCARFSQTIFRDREAARYPELAALAFWMRKAELIRLRDEFARAGRPDAIALPRGLIFHIPPANVDTIFVYSWLLAALVGNRNVIRMSSRRSPQSDILLRLWRESLPQAAPALENSAVVIRYDHDDEVTRALSLLCDVRVIWGGDHTVSSIRRIPLAPHARELTFPDRSSLAAIKADRYAELDGAGRHSLAEQFFNDAYWFDQIACSSPRLLVWCGETERVRQASDAFWTSLAASIERKHYVSPPAMHMRKLVFACQSVLNLPVAEYRRYAETTVLRLDSLTSIPREHCGGGLFFSVRAGCLEELAQVLQRKDQTLTHFGFSSAELQDFARRLGGKAIDRMVPIGQALQFNRFWDGYDLLHEFCRFTYCEAQANGLTALRR